MFLIVLADKHSLIFWVVTSHMQTNLISNVYLLAFKDKLDYIKFFINDSNMQSVGKCFLFNNFKVIE